LTFSAQQNFGIWDLDAGKNKDLLLHYQQEHAFNDMRPILCLSALFSFSTRLVRKGRKGNSLFYLGNLTQN
jgi:hypothetical protein